mmetsp:Transcript_41443/g.130267  ORF Transcript_41443/g.130267 Transcript_41443/m.130267 type:complete len:201 (+) Transcript_41443:227-829(+)
MVAGARQFGSSEPSCAFLPLHSPVPAAPAASLRLHLLEQRGQHRAQALLQPAVGADHLLVGLGVVDTRARGGLVRALPIVRRDDGREVAAEPLVHLEGPLARLPPSRLKVGVVSIHVDHRSYQPAALARMVGQPSHEPHRKLLGGRGELLAPRLLAPGGRLCLPLLLGGRRLLRRQAGRMQRLRRVAGCLLIRLLVAARR